MAMVVQCSRDCLRLEGRYILYIRFSVRLPRPFGVSIAVLLPNSIRLHRHAVAVVRGPDSSDTLVDTRDGLIDTLDLVAAGVSQQLGLLEDLRGLHVGDADGLLPAVDVVADHDGVLPRPGRHGELDGRVRLGKLGEMGLDEGAGPCVRSAALL